MEQQPSFTSANDVSNIVARINNIEAAIRRRADTCATIQNQLNSLNRYYMHSMLQLRRTNVDMITLQRELNRMYALYEAHCQTNHLMFANLTNSFAPSTNNTYMHDDVTTNNYLNASRFGSRTEAQQPTNMDILAAAATAATTNPASEYSTAFSANINTFNDYIYQNNSATTTATSNSTAATNNTATGINTATTNNTATGNNTAAAADNAATDNDDDDEFNIRVFMYDVNRPSTFRLRRWTHPAIEIFSRIFDRESQTRSTDDIKRKLYLCRYQHYVEAVHSSTPIDVALRNNYNVNNNDDIEDEEDDGVGTYVGDEDENEHENENENETTNSDDAAVVFDDVHSANEIAANEIATNEIAANETAANETAANERETSSLNDSIVHTCPITYRSFTSRSKIAIIRQCGHVFSRKAIVRWFRQTDHTTCPLCRAIVFND